MKNVIFLLITLVTSSCMAKESLVNQVKIYYVPIGVETYVPMTVDNIETSYVRYGEVDIDERGFKKLMSIVSKADSGNFDEGMLRAKIILPDHKIVYIDNYGGLNSYQSESLKLVDSNFKKIKKILEGLTEPRNK